MSVSVSGFAQYTGGDGTSADPYLISSQTDLETLADSVNNHAKTYSGVYFKLAKTVSTDSIIGKASGTPFQGVFDGDSLNIYVNIVAATSDECVGVFGYIDGAEIRNLRVSGTITPDAGALYVAGICGYAANSVIERCENAVQISSTQYAGGICGYALSSTIEQCNNVAQIESTSTTVLTASGGICGWGDGASINDCYNSGLILSNTTAGGESSYSGGICGYADNTTAFTNCYNIGGISTVSPNHSTYYGGIAGYADNSTISSCFAARVGVGYSGATGTGGRIVGAVNTSTISYCYATSSVVVNGSTSLIVGSTTKHGATENITDLASVNSILSTPFSTTIWGEDGDFVNFGYPILKSKVGMRFRLTITNNNSTLGTVNATTMPNILTTATITTSLGGNQIIDFTPSSINHEVDSVKVDAVSIVVVPTGGNYTFTNIDDHHQIDVYFGDHTPPPPAVDTIFFKVVRNIGGTFDTLPGGVLDPLAKALVKVGLDLGVVVLSGDSITHGIWTKSDPDYQVDSLWLNTESPQVFANKQLDFEINTQADNVGIDSVKVSFRRKPHTIKPVVVNPAGGSISPDSIVIAHGGGGGAMNTFTITPSLGYAIDTLKVGGIDRTDFAIPYYNTYTYEFNNVLADSAVYIRFVPLDTIVVTPIIGDGGTVSPPGAGGTHYVYVKQKRDTTFVLKPALGYSIDSVLVNGTDYKTDVSNDTLFSLTAAQRGAISKSELTVKFTRMDTILVNIYANGALRNSGTPTPLGGHILYAGTDTVDWNYTGGGSFDGLDTIPIKRGQNGTFSIMAASGYGIDSVFVGQQMGAAANKVSSMDVNTFNYTFTNVSGDSVLSVYFRQRDTIKAYASGGGGIYIDGTLVPLTSSSPDYTFIEIPFGRDTTLVFRPNVDHVVDSVFVGHKDTLYNKLTFVPVVSNSKRPSDTTYHFSTMSGDSAIYVKFIEMRKIKLYVGNNQTGGGSGTNGAIHIYGDPNPLAASPPNADTVLVRNNTDTTFTFKPDPGHAIDSVWINGKEYVAPLLTQVDGGIFPTDSTYQFSHVTGDSTLRVKFVQMDTIRVDIYANGTLRNSGTPTPLGGHIIYAVNDTVDWSYSGGGSFNGLDTIPIKRGQNGVFRIDAASGYGIDSVFVGQQRGAAANKVSSMDVNTFNYTLTNVSGDSVLSVYFRQRNTIEAYASGGGGIYIDGNSVLIGSSTPASVLIEIPYGRDTTLVFRPDAGNAVDSVFVGPQATAYNALTFVPVTPVGTRGRLTDSTYRFADMKADSAIYVKFIEMRKIKLYVGNNQTGGGSGTNGAIHIYGDPNPLAASPPNADTVLVRNNTDTTFTFRPNPGFAIDSVWINGKKYAAPLQTMTPAIFATDSTYRFSHVTGDSILRVSFVKMDTIHVTVRPRGKLYLNGSSFADGGTATVGGVGVTKKLPIRHGSDTTFVIGPYAGYLIDSVKVGGRNSSMVDRTSGVVNDTFRLRNITVDTIFEVKFVEEATLTLSTFGSGKIVMNGDSVNGSVTVKQGRDVRLTLVPGTRNVIDTVLVNGSDSTSRVINNANSCTFNVNPSVQNTFYVRFTAVDTIKATIGTKGGIFAGNTFYNNTTGSEINRKIPTKHGQNKEIIFRSAAGYVVDSVWVNSIYVSPSSSSSYPNDTTYIFQNVLSDDSTIRVTFVQVVAIPMDTIKVKASQGGSYTVNGGVSCTGTMEVPVTRGTRPLVTFRPDKYYIIDTVVATIAGIVYHYPPAIKSTDRFQTDSTYLFPYIYSNDSIRVVYTKIDSIRVYVGNNLAGGGTGTSGKILIGTNVIADAGKFADTVPIRRGSDTTFIFRPDLNCGIDSVWINGKGYAAPLQTQAAGGIFASDSTYQFSKVSGDSSIRVSFIEQNKIKLYVGNNQTGGGSGVNGGIYGGLTHLVGAPNSTDSILLVRNNIDTTFTFRPDPGHAIDSVWINEKGYAAPLQTQAAGGIFATDSTYKFQNVTGDSTLRVTFVKMDTIHVTVKTGGSVSLNGATIFGGTTIKVPIRSGNDTTFLIHPLSSMLIDSVKVINSISGSVVDMAGAVVNNTFRLIKVHTDTTLEISFVYKEHIDLSVEGNGSIKINNTPLITSTGSATLEIKRGRDTTLTIVPDAGWLVDSVSVNGSDLTATVAANAGKYRFLNVNSTFGDSKIYVRFAQVVPPDTIHATIGAKGGIFAADINEHYINSGSGAAIKKIPATHGQNSKLIFRPMPGYAVDSVWVNSIYVSPLSSLSYPNDTTYIFQHVLSNDSTIQVTFVRMDTIKVICNTIGGSIAVNGKSFVSGTEVPVKRETRPLVTFRPDKGYIIDTIIVGVLHYPPNGKSINYFPTDSTYQFDYIYSNDSIRVVYTKIDSIRVYVGNNLAGGGTGTSGKILIGTSVIADAGKFADTVPIRRGNDTTFIFRPDLNCGIDSVWINGTVYAAPLPLKSAGGIFASDSTYQFSKVSGDSSIRVSFIEQNKIKLYVGSSPTGGGSGVNGGIYGGLTHLVGAPNSTDSILLVRNNIDTTFTFRPDPSHAIDSVWINEKGYAAPLQTQAAGGIFATDSTYKFRNVTGDSTLRVSFVKMDTIHVTVRPLGKLYLNGSSFADGGFGVVGGSGVTTKLPIRHGSDTTFVIEPYAGYLIDSVKVISPISGSVVDMAGAVVNNTFRLINVCTDTILEISFVYKEHIDLSVEGNGSIQINNTPLITGTGSATLEIKQGGDTTLTIVPDAGWLVDSVSVNGSNSTATVISAGNKYRFTNVNSAFGDSKFYVRFVQVDTIHARIGAKGAIFAADMKPPSTYPNNSGAPINIKIPAQHGQNSRLIFRPMPGYAVDSVWVNSIYVSPLSSSSYPNDSTYIFRNVQADSAIRITFVQMDTIKVKASQGGRYTVNGGVSYSGTQEVPVKRGTRPLVTFRPDKGYIIDTIVVGVFHYPPTPKSTIYFPTDSTYQFGYVSSNDSIRVVYTKIDSIRVYVGNNLAGGGTRTPGKILIGTSVIADAGKFADTVPIRRGNDTTFIFRPNVDCVIDSVWINGKGYRAPLPLRSAGGIFASDSTYQFSKVSGDSSIRVSFIEMRKIKLYVGSSLTGGGSGFNGGIYGGLAHLVGAPNSTDSILLVKNNSDTTFTFRPNPGHAIDSVWINGKGYAAPLQAMTPAIFATDSTYQFSHVTGDSTLRVSFVKMDTIHITVRPRGKLYLNGSSFADGGGTATVGGVGVTTKLPIRHGNDTTFVIEPYGGYLIDSVKVGGHNSSMVDRASGVVNNTFRLRNITVDTIFEVKFVEEATLTLSTFGSGKIVMNGDSVNGSVTVKKGRNAILTLVPGIRNMIDTVLVNGNDSTSMVINNANSYTFSNVSLSALNTFYVRFIVVDTISATIGKAGLGTNGGIFAAGIGKSYTSIGAAINKIPAKHGRDSRLIFRPTAGYAVDSVWVNSIYVSPLPSLSYPNDSTYVFQNVQSSGSTIQVTFVRMDTIKVITNVGGSYTVNGGVSYSGTQEVPVKRGTRPLVTFRPDKGYIIDTIEAQGVRYPPSANMTNHTTDSTYKFSYIFSNDSVRVVYTKIDSIRVYVGNNSTGGGTGTFGKILIGTNVIADAGKFADTVKIRRGNDTTFIFRPNVDCAIDSVWINGKGYTAPLSSHGGIFASDSTYQFSNVSGDSSIRVSFIEMRKIKLYVGSTPTGGVSGGNGDIYGGGALLAGASLPSPNDIADTILVKNNSDTTFTFRPQSTYGIDSVWINEKGYAAPLQIKSAGGIFATDSTYQFSHVTGDSTLRVSFVRMDTILVNIYANGALRNSGAPRGGHILYAGTDTVDWNYSGPIFGGRDTISIKRGKNGVFSIVADPGYGIDSVFVGQRGGVFSANKVTPMDISTFNYTLINVNGDSVLSVYFQKRDTIRAYASAGGDIYIGGNSVLTGPSIPAYVSIEIPYGRDTTLVFRPNVGHVVDSVFVGPKDTAYTKLTFVPVVSNSKRPSDTTYHFSTMSGDSAIYVKFIKMDTVRVNVYADGGGGIGTMRGGNIILNGRNVYPDELITATTPPTKLPFRHGADSTFVFRPEPGYIVDSLFVGVGADRRYVSITDSTYKLAKVTGDSVLSVRFVARDTVRMFKLSYLGGPLNGGSIIPGTLAKVYTRGRDTAQYRIEPYASYQVDSVTLNKINIPATLIIADTSIYKFLTVRLTDTLRVFFGPKIYVTPQDSVFIETVSEPSGTVGGSVRITGGSSFANSKDTARVDRGTDPIFTFTPNPGYALDSVWVDNTYNATALTLEQYVFNNITSNHSLKVKFVRMDTIFLEVKTGEGALALRGGHIKYGATLLGGSPTYKGKQAMRYESEPTFTFVPDPGYECDSLWVGQLFLRKLSPTDVSYQFPSIDGNDSLKVNFKRKKYLASATVKNYVNGSISSVNPNYSLGSSYGGSVLVHHDTIMSFNITPGPGYGIDSVKVNDVDSLPSWNKNGAALVGQPAIKITGPTTVVASFVKLDTIFLISKPVVAGTFSNPNDTILIKPFKDTALIFYPTAGYAVDSVKFNGTNVRASVVGDSVYKATVNALHNELVVRYIEVDTIKRQYVGAGNTLQAAPSNGQIVFASDSVVRRGKDSVEIRIRPNVAMALDTLWVGSRTPAYMVPYSMIRNDSIYKFVTTAILASLTNGPDPTHINVIARFKNQPVKITTLLTSASQSWGDILSNPDTVVTYGQPFNILIQPKPGYMFNALTVNSIDSSSKVIKGLSTPTVDTFKISSAKTNYNIVVSLIKQDTLKVINLTTSGGRINQPNKPYTSPLLLKHDGHQEILSIKPNSGYFIDSILWNRALVRSNDNGVLPSSLGNGIVKDAGNDSTYKLPVTNGTDSIKVSFVERDTIQVITYNTSYGGVYLASTLVTTTPAYYKKGVVKLYKIEPTNASYELDSMTVGAIGVDTIVLKSTNLQKIGTFYEYSDTAGILNGLPATHKTIKVWFKVKSYNVIVRSHYRNVISQLTPTLVATPPTDGGKVLWVENSNKDVTNTGPSNQVPYYGTLVTLELVPSPGYAVDSVYVDGVYNPNAVSTRLVKIQDNSDEDKTCDVKFIAIDTIMTSVSPSGHGTISPVGNVIVKRGSSQSFVLTPDLGYGVDTLLKGRSSDKPNLAGGNAYTLLRSTTGPWSNDTVYVSFAKVKNRIDPHSPDPTRGTIQPSTDTTIYYDEVMVYNFVAKPGFIVDSVKINGVSVTPTTPTSHTFSNITSYQNLYVSFIEADTIEAIINGANLGASISPNFIYNVKRGRDSVSINISPNAANVELATFTLDGVDVKSSLRNNETLYRFVSTQSRHKIEAEFQYKPLNVTHGVVPIGVSGDGGSMSAYPATINPVPFGDTITFTITPAQGYDIDTLRVNGVDATRTVYRSGADYKYDLAVIQTTDVRVRFVRLDTIDVTNIPPSGVTVISPTGRFFVKDKRDTLLPVQLTTGGSSPYGYAADTIKWNNGPWVAVTSDGMTYRTPVLTQPMNSLVVKYIAKDFITASVAPGESTRGTIFINGRLDTTVRRGRNVTFSITPTVGYTVDSVTCNGINRSGNLSADGRSFTIASTASTVNNGLLSVVVYFKPTRHRLLLTVADPATGTISPPSGVTVSDTTVDFGSTVVYSFHPIPGFDIDSLLVDGVNWTSSVTNGTFPFTFTQADTLPLFNMVVAYSQRDTIDVTYQDNAGSSISPSQAGGLPVFHGREGTYVIESNMYRELDALLLDGVDITNQVHRGASQPGVSIFDTLYFASYNTHHLMHLIFKPRLHLIQASIASGSESGRMSPAGDTNVVYNSNVTYYFAANEGYRMDSVVVNGVNNVAAAQAGQYTFSAVSSNQSIVVYFKKLHQIIVTTGDYGSIRSAIRPLNPPLDTLFEPAGGSRTFTFVPGADYRVGTVLIDGVEDPAAALARSYTFVNIAADHTLEVTFLMGNPNLTSLEILYPQELAIDYQPYQRVYSATMPCDENKLVIRAEPPMGGTVTITYPASWDADNSYASDTVIVNVPGIDSIRIHSELPGGVWKDYFIILTRPFGTELIQQFWNDVLAVNLPYAATYGYKFETYEWVKGSTALGKYGSYLYLEDLDFYYLSSDAWTLRVTPEYSSKVPIPPLCPVHVLTSTGLHIYPNPAYNSVTFEDTAWPEMRKYEILDLNGRLWKTFPATGVRTTVDISDFPAGLYIVNVQTKDGPHTEKMVVVR
ncbi:hypothetical protein FACS1894199_05480 [Bacteroidia bacterium]|nr:hypothetical protein FACS1894199_05480 [Bacteroidia bacterium]